MCAVLVRIAGVTFFSAKCSQGLQRFKTNTTMDFIKNEDVMPTTPEEEKEEGMEGETAPAEGDMGEGASAPEEEKTEGDQM